jgi:hypothetical protein
MLSDSATHVRGERKHAVRGQGRDTRSPGEDVHIACTKDDVRRQPHRRGRCGVRVRERDRWRAGPFGARRVTSAEPVARKRGVARQTPRVGVVIRRTALAKRPQGRSELKPFTDWDDGRPETELNFKFYRQATNKIVGISDAAAAFLDGFF